MESRELKAIRERCGYHEWWWARDDALAVISYELDKHRFCVIDHFLPRDDISRLSRQIYDIYAAGHLSIQGAIGGGRLGRDGKEIEASIRRDSVGYFEGTESIWADTTLKGALDKMNTLVCELRDNKSKSSQIHAASVQRIQSELVHTLSRSRAMISCYSGAQNAYYSAHCDNLDRNGRKLTVILYPNQDWPVDAGGMLRIFGEVTSHTEEVSGIIEGLPHRSGDSFHCINPIMNRLVLFWSDSRCPHDVTAVINPQLNRFAVTLWFIDREEKIDALQSVVVVEGPNGMSELESSGSLSQDVAYSASTQQAHCAIPPDTGMRQGLSEQCSWTIEVDSTSCSLLATIQIFDQHLWEHRTCIVCNAYDGYIDLVDGRITTPLKGTSSLITRINVDGWTVQRSTVAAKFRSKNKALIVSAKLSK